MLIVRYAAWYLLAPGYQIVRFVPPSSVTAIAVPPSPEGKALRNICQFQVLCSVFGDEILSLVQGIAQKHIEIVGGALGILGHDLDEAAGLRVHGGHPHHLRVVFTETLGALNLHLLTLQFLEDLRLFALIVGKPGLVLAGNLKQRGFCDIHIAVTDQRGAKAVDHSQDQGTDLEAVVVRIGTDDHLVPAEVV